MMRFASKATPTNDYNWHIKAVEIVQPINGSVSRHLLLLSSDVHIQTESHRQTDRHTDFPDESTCERPGKCQVKTSMHLVQKNLHLSTSSAGNWIAPYEN